MAVRRPVVRHFIACEEVERSADGQHYSLLKLVYTIRPLTGEPYPRIHPQLQLYAMLTDGVGRLPFTVELVTWDEIEPRSIYTTRTVIVDMGSDPLLVHGWPIRLRNLVFERPGLYEFRLICDGEIIARESILLKEAL